MRPLKAYSTRYSCMQIVLMPVRERVHAMPLAPAPAARPDPRGAPEPLERRSRQAA